VWRSAWRRVLTLIATTFANSSDINQDLYGRNILFTAPAIATISSEQIMSYLGAPKTGPITRRDGHCCEPSMPSYLVRPASIRGSDTEIKIVDLGNGSAELNNMLCAEANTGKAFFHNNPPKQLSTPWHVRAPEAIYSQPLSKYVDMWSMGCLVSTVTFLDSCLPYIPNSEHI
jgi:serine/threonine-protein kinase SRPK3